MEEGEAELSESSLEEDFQLKQNQEIINKLTTKKEKKSESQIDNILKKLKDDQVEESKYDKKRSSTDL